MAWDTATKVAAVGVAVSAIGTAIWIPFLLSTNARLARLQAQVAPSSHEAPASSE